MKITTAGTLPSRRAPADYFTGTVWQDPVIEAEEPARLNAVCVTFEPGARTAWHSGRRCSCCRAAVVFRVKVVL